jgi:hypothetical protein
MNIALVIMDGDPLPVKYEEYLYPVQRTNYDPWGKGDAGF